MKQEKWPNVSKHNAPIFKAPSQKIIQTFLIAHDLYKHGFCSLNLFRDPKRMNEVKQYDNAV